MRITAEPRSDQINADDFVGSPRIFTIAGVRAGTAEQKYDVLLEGEQRVWRPPLTVLRLLMAAWGDEAEVWKGRRVELYRDASVSFGPEAVGGIRVSRMSDLPDGKPFTARVTVKRGKRAPLTVEPLPDVPAAVTPEQIAASTDEAELKGWWRGASDEQKQQILARVDALKQQAELVDEHWGTATDDQEPGGSR